MSLSLNVTSEWYTSKNVVVNLSRFFFYFSLSISHITACAPNYVCGFIDAAYAVAYLLRRDRVAHDNSRIPRWAQTQKETHEAGTVPAPEPLIGCNGFRKVCWRTMVVAAKRVCQNNKKKKQCAKPCVTQQQQTMYAVSLSSEDWTSLV